MTDYLYKILPKSEWVEWQASPHTHLPLSDLDRQDGFVHLSELSQVLETCERYFKHQSIVLLCLRKIQLKDAVKWEWVESRQMDFPHLFRPIHREDIAAIQRILWENGSAKLGALTNMSTM